jgi:UDP-GlcNAc:undecaprenyl-phosphate GlcNAc-1-phosphate transferase
VSGELQALVACAVAGLVTIALTPGAIWLAWRTDLIDRPREYRAHAAPTPYLGGLALMGGFLVAAVVFGDAGRFWAPLVCAVAMCALGTLDDARPVRPRYRVIAEVAAAGLLTAAGAGWTFPSSGLETFLLNAAWIVGFTNAFNLMDNMDGAASTVAAACSGWIGAVALVKGDAGLAAMSLAIAGACCGFLRANLRTGTGRARIFLGDGGSMPLGFIVAVCAASVPYDSSLGGGPMLLAASLLLGIPVLDTMLVTISRTRRGVSILTGGRDHLTHRLRTRLLSPARVAVALALLQSLTAALALVALSVGRTTVVVSAVVCLAAGGMIIALLERPVFLVGSGAEHATHAEPATSGN